MTSGITIIHIEDDPDWCHEIKAYISRKGTLKITNFMSVSSIEDVRAKLQVCTEPTIVIMDLRFGTSMINYSGLHWVLEELEDFARRNVNKSAVFVISGELHPGIHEILTRRGIPSDRIYNKGYWAESRSEFLVVLHQVAGWLLAAKNISENAEVAQLDAKVTSRKLRVFLCHARSDKPRVRQLFERLRVDNVDPWLDEEQLLPGQDWRQEITSAVKRSDVVIVCLSSSSISKTGFVQNEIKYALDAADSQPEGTIFLIPLRLEECETPDQLSRWQWVNYFEETGYHRLMMALSRRAESLGIIAKQ